MKTKEGMSGNKRVREVKVSNNCELEGFWCPFYGIIKAEFPTKKIKSLLFYLFSWF